MLKLYENIKNRRNDLKMTQSQLAKLVGYKDRSMIAQIEHGDIDLPQSKIIMIADALRVTPSYLMGDDGTQEQAFVKKMSPMLVKLNDAGQKKVEEYVSDILEIDKYSTVPKPKYRHLRKPADRDTIRKIIDSFDLSLMSEDDRNRINKETIASDIVKVQSIRIDENGKIIMEEIPVEDYKKRMIEKSTKADDHKKVKVPNAADA